MSRSEFPVSVQKAAYARAGGICECGCNQPFTDHPKEIPNYDHILPCALGGENGLDNCQVLRWCCHVVKTKAHDTARISKAIRGEKQRRGIKAKSSGRGFQTNRGGKFKQPIGGNAERRIGGSD